MSSSTSRSDRVASLSPLSASDAPLFRFREERPYIVAEVARRTYKSYLAQARTHERAGLEYVLNETAFHEISRLATERGPEDEVRPRGWWVRMAKGLSERSEVDRRELLRQLIDAYVEDVAGQFNPNVYRLATKTLPIGLGVLFKAQDLGDLSDVFPHPIEAIHELRDLSERVVVSGHVDTVRALQDRGTLLVVPTHSSNMDSILVGYALYQSGLAPVTYGAGKNLFANPLTGFFMHNLGAYKVDRRLRHDLYKRVLKTYSQVLLERGYHSLFFPGGTRCRSNIVEDHLKLGLLGTATAAYIRTLRHGLGDRRIYLCPLTINYNLVLEAESLIREHLRREGGARYFLENDQFDQISTVVRFVLNSMNMESTTILRFGQPMDPFGNAVEADGESYDERGRRLDPMSYVRRAKDGLVCADTARDRQYTRHAGERIAASFRENTVIMPTQLVSYVCFELLQRRFPTWDVYRLLRMGGEEVISWEELRAGTEALLDEVRPMAEAGTFHLAPILTQAKPGRIAELGIEYLRMFHAPPPVDFHTSGVLLERLDLLYFYSNRLRGYGVDDQGWIARMRRELSSSWTI